MDYCADFNQATAALIGSMQQDRVRPRADISGIGKDSPAYPMAAIGKILADNAGMYTGINLFSQYMDRAIDGFLKQHEPETAKKYDLLKQQVLAAEQKDLRNVPFDKLDAELDAAATLKREFIAQRGASEHRLRKHCIDNGKYDAFKP